MLKGKGSALNEREFVASATECTGLVPAMPLDDQAADEELARLYAVIKPLERSEEVRKECQTKVRKRREEP